MNIWCSISNFGFMFYNHENLQVAIKYPIARCKPIKLIIVLVVEASFM